MIAREHKARESIQLLAALEYAALGWHIFPCHTIDDGACSCGKDCGRNAGKHPLANVAPHGLLDATTDPSALREMFALFPDANPAIRTGEISDIAVIDVDPRSGGRDSLRGLERDLGPLPLTVAGRTGGGGDHLIFAHTRHVPSRAHVVPGVDIRDDSAYIVAPPSRHLSGGVYSWASGRSPNDLRPAPLPDAWLNFLAPPRESRQTQTASGRRSLTDDDRAKALRLLGPHYVAGFRHDLTLALSGWLGLQGYGEKDVARLIEALAEDDHEREKRLGNVETTFKRLAAKEDVIGWWRLKELLPLATRDTLEALLGSPTPTITINGRRPEASNGRTDQTHGGVPGDPPSDPPGETPPPPVAGAHLTDMGNAERLRRLHGHDLKYCKAWGYWLVYSGRHWQRDDTDDVVRLAKDMVGSIYAEAASAGDENERKAIAKHALKSEGEARIRAAISLAESEPGIPARSDQFDRHRWLLNCQNGTLDLQTGELRPHDRDDLLTKLVPVDYDPAATCPTFLAFLDRIMGGNERLIAFLQKAAGYSLTGIVRERVLLILHGEGRNGKSTLLETLRGVYGDYGMRTPTETLLAKRDTSIPNDVARLKGLRLVTASEADEGRRFDEARIKDLTGADTISARFMRGEWFDFLPEFKLWLGTNHKPVIRGTDKAIWDRIRLVPFTVRIPEAEEDKDLRAKLLAEGPGILAWAVQGCLAWQRDGLGAPEEVKQATAGYRAEMDVLGDFIEDRCVIGGGASVTAKDLYAAYHQWCKDSGEEPMTQKAMGLRLAERGFDSARMGNKRTRTWIGIGLMADPGASN